MATEQVESALDFIIDEVVVTSERSGREYNIGAVVSELNLFEHIDKPYITGKILFVDNARVIERLNLSGTEKVLVKIRIEEEDSILYIEKNFYIEEITKSIKTNDDTEIVGISIIEDIAYISQLSRISKSFRGSPSAIIQRVIEDHLNRKLFNLSEKEYTETYPMRVVVPNMTPIDTINWIKDRASTNNGMPFFLFSTLCDDRIRYLDLETMIKLNPLNISTREYSYVQGVPNNANAADKVLSSYMINSYNHTSNENQLYLARKGAIGSTYNFIDTMTNTTLTKKINADDIFKRIEFPSNQNEPSYDSKSKFQESVMHEYDTTEISQISPTVTYDDDTFNYYESKDVNTHMHKAESRALRYFLHKSAIDINVPGRNFLYKDTNKSIGNVIRISFKANEVSLDENNATNNRDKKKSGNYFIYAARHVFQANQYTVNLSCTKLSHEKGVG
jgi:hypothetical protein